MKTSSDSMPTRPQKFILLTTCLLASFVATQASAQVANEYWAEDLGATLPNGNWEDSTGWSPSYQGFDATTWTEGGFPIIAAATAAGSFTVTANANHTVAGILWNRGATLTLGGPGVLTLASGQQGLIANGTTMIISNVLAGPGAVYFTYSGVVLYGNNTFSGGCEIPGTIVYLGNNNAFGTGTITNSYPNGFGALIPEPPATSYTIPNAWEFANNGAINFASGSIAITCTGDWDCTSSGYAFIRNNGLSGTAGAVLTLTGKLTNSGGLNITANNNGTVLLQNPNSTYLGQTAIGGNSPAGGAGGTTPVTLSIGADGCLGTPPSSFTPNAITMGCAFSNTATFGAILLANSSFILNANRGITLMTNACVIEAAPGATLTYAGAITGGFNLALNSATQTGTLILGGASTYTGTNTLASGIVQLNGAESAGSSGPLGEPSTVANSVVLNGATLQFSSANTFDYSPRFSTAASQKYNFDVNGQPVTFATGLTSSGGVLVLSSSAGGGSLTLSGANTYTGGTTVNGGALDVSGSVAGNVTVNGPGTLDITSSGSVTGNVTVNNSAANALELDSTTALSASAVLNLPASPSGVAYLNFSGTQTITSLNFGTVSMPAGTYGAPGTGATFQLTAFAASGTGILSVTTGGTYWDPGFSDALSGSGGNGNWDTTTTNWFSTVTNIDAAWPANDDATFAGAAGTVTVAANVAANGLTFATAGYSITNSDGVSTLALGGAAPTITVPAGTTAIGCDITGGGTSVGLIASGPGTLVLAGTNTYGNGTTVTNGATLSVSTISDSGTSAIGNSGTFTLGGGTLSYTGTTAATTTRQFSGIGTSGTINLPNSSGSLAINNRLTTLSGNFSVNLTGAGTLYLEGAADNSALGMNVGTGTTVVLAKASASTVHGLGGATTTISNGGAVILGGGVAGASGNYQLFSATPMIINSGGVLDLDGNQDTTGTLTISGVGPAGATYPGALINSSTTASQITNNGVSATGVTLVGNTTIGGQGNITEDSRISGAFSITYAGTAQLALTNTNNAFTGGIIINGGGTVLLTNAWTAGGTGAITLAAANSTLAIGITGNNAMFSNVITGPGIVNIKETSANNLQLVGSMSGFTGSLNAPASASAAKLQILTTGVNISSSATLNLAAGGTLYVANPGVTIPCAVNVGGTGNTETYGALRIENTGLISGPVVLGGSTTVGNNQTGTTKVGTISGVISDGGHGYGITKTSPAGIIVLSGADTFTGPITISGGVLQMGGAGSLAGGTYANTISIATASAFIYNSSVAQNLTGIISGAGGLGESGPGALTLKGVNTYSGSTTNSATLTIGGSGSLGSGAYAGTIVNSGSFVYNSSAAQTLSGVISGSGSLTENGSGKLTLNAADTYTGPTTIATGNTLALGSAGSIGSTASITIPAGATFDVSALISYTGGNGTTIIANGTGTTGPTASTIIGPASSTVSLGSEPLSLAFTPTSFTGDLTHPSLYISQGSLSLSGNVYTVSNTTVTPLGVGSYTLIQQASGSVISSGLSSVTVTGGGIIGGAEAIIQVSGGSVNLIIQNLPANNPWIWDGNDFGSNPNWSDGNNWNNAPTPPALLGDNVIFAGSAGTTPVMDNAYGVNSLTFASTAGAFTLDAAGNSLGVAAGVTDNSTAPQIINIPMLLGNDGPPGPSQWSIPASGSITVNSNITDTGVGMVLSGGGTLDLLGTNNASGGINNNGCTLEITGAGQLSTSGNTYSKPITNNGSFIYGSTAGETLSGVISGSGSFTHNGTGTLTLGAANSYAGITTVGNGSLQITSDANLGTPPGSFVANQLTLNNNINGGANNYGLRVQTTSFALNANRGITIGPLGASINVQNGITFTIPGVITGTGAFWASPNSGAGYGTILLSNNNTYSGPTFIGAGSLRLGINGALPTGTPLTIGSSLLATNGGSFFDMSGKSQTIGPLASNPGFGTTGLGMPMVTNLGALTIYQTNVTTTFGGMIVSTPGNLTGTVTVTVPPGGTPGLLILNGSNIYTGQTFLAGATVQADFPETPGASGPFGNSLAANPDSIVMAGGTLQYSPANTFDYSGRFGITPGQLYNIDLNGEVVAFGTSLSSSGGSLNVTSTGSAGSLALNAANSYSGTTTIGTGATVVLGSTGSISNTSSISIAPGATFDVSSADPFTLSSSTTLIASGTGATSGVNAASINDAGGTSTINLGSQPIHLTFTPTSFTGDLTHPSLYVPSGNLTLNGNAFTVSNASGTPLGTGTYTLIQQTSGAVNSSGSFPVTVTGSGMAGGAVAAIQVSGTAVSLVVVVVPKPVINQFSRSGSSLTFSGTNGLANSNYWILTSTNVALPLPSWSKIFTNTFGPTGNFSNTITVTNTPSFYIIEIAP